MNQNKMKITSYQFYYVYLEFEDENGKTNLSLDIFTRIVEVLQISADWLIMADIPQTMEYSSAELSRLLADCSVSESKAILKMAENLKEILRSQK